MCKAFKSHSQSGFSLVEILIATTILSFMMAGLYTMVDQNAKTTKTVTTEDRDFLSGYVAINKIEEDLSLIYSPLYYAARKRPQPDGQSQGEVKDYTPPQFPFPTIVDVPAPQLESVDKSTLIFFNASNRRKYEDQKQSKYQWIKYSLRAKEKNDAETESDIETGDFQLIRQVINEAIYKPDLDWDGARPQVMLDNVKEFQIEYWDPKRKKFVESLRELDVDDRLAPKGFSVSISWYDRSGIEQKGFKTIRPLWPAFDTLKDEIERRPPKQNNQNPNGVGGGEPVPPIEDEGDFE